MLSPTYRSWGSMRYRCLSPTAKDYPRYGGRGIKIDPRWDDFSLFLADMGPRPPGTTLDRKDVNGDYTKDNCRWSTAKVQANNKTNTVALTHNGRTLTLSAWAAELGMKEKTIRRRHTTGWSTERILTQGVRRYGHNPRG